MIVFRFKAKFAGIDGEDLKRKNMGFIALCHAGEGFKPWQVQGAGLSFWLLSVFLFGAGAAFLHILGLPVKWLHGLLALPCPASPSSWPFVACSAHVQDAKP